MSEKKARIYLDLDGVIYPIAPLYEANVDPEEVDMLHEHEWWRKSIVQRLGNLGVEIVMSSSWGEIFMERTPAASPREVINPARALATSYSGLPKEEAVALDLQEDPMPFIWIDDHLNQNMIDVVKNAIPNSVHGLYVAPDKMQGLTHDEITAIEKGFLEQL